MLVLKVLDNEKLETFNFELRFTRTAYDAFSGS